MQGNTNHNRFSHVTVLLSFSIENSIINNWLRIDRKN